MKAFYLVKFLSLNIIDRIDLLQFLERIDFHDILLTDRLYNDLVIGQLFTTSANLAA